MKHTSLLTALLIGVSVQIFAADANLALTWIRGSSVAVEQMIGDCDYAVQAKTGTCQATTSQTATRARVLGTDLGASFESNGKVIFLFGDSFGPAADYLAADTIATSTSTNPDTGLFLDFLVNSDGTPFFVKVPGIRLGASEVPSAGIHLDSGTFAVCTTGMDRNLPQRDINASSVLTRFDETTRRFTPLRTISMRPNGRFINSSLHTFGSDVLMYGLGAYRASDVYLAKIPAATFDNGQGTQYFAGMVNGQPIWTTSESGAVPVVVDNPLHSPNNTPGIGNVSVTYCDDVDLWLMTYDGGRQSQTTAGVYFAYAREPWGPWSEPQLIFNPKRDGAMGKFIHDPTSVPNDGLNGPTIGGNDPYTTPGAPYAPYMIERFTRVSANTLSIYYTISTWNPYTIVEMRSDFAISRVRRHAVRH